jgi:hypothetical protein
VTRDALSDLAQPPSEPSEALRRAIETARSFDPFSSAPRAELASQEARDLLQKIQRLLLAGADPNARADPRRRQAPLLIIAIERGRPDLVEALLDGGADPNQSNELERSAVFAAGMLADEASLELLVRRGANLDLQDAFGETAVQWTRKWTKHPEFASRIENWIHWQDINRAACPTSRQKSGHRL